MRVHLISLLIGSKGWTGTKKLNWNVWHIFQKVGLDPNLRLGPKNCVDSVLILEWRTETYRLQNNQSPLCPKQSSTQNQKSEEESDSIASVIFLYSLLLLPLSVSSKHAASDHPSSNSRATYSFSCIFSDRSHSLFPTQIRCSATRFWINHVYVLMKSMVIMKAFGVNVNCREVIEHVKRVYAENRKWIWEFCSLLNVVRKV